MRLDDDAVWIGIMQDWEWSLPWIHYVGTKRTCIAFNEK